MSDSEEQAGREGQTEQDEPELLYELRSAKETANLLRVSESTVWRYADRDLLPAYRIGPKRVMFRRSDVEALLNRLRRKKEQPLSATENLRLFSMSEGSRPAADAMARAKEVRDRILVRRGGVPVSESWEDINASREERTADL